MVATLNFFSRLWYCARDDGFMMLRLNKSNRGTPKSMMTSGYICLRSYDSYFLIRTCLLLQYPQ